MSINSYVVRTLFRHADARRDAGLKTPGDILRYNDIVYGKDRKWQVLDVYRPKGYKGKKLPVIVSVHGGGWVYGNKEVYRFYCMNLAQRGFAVVNFTYRLAPKHKYPASIEDTNLVFHWIMKYGEKYGMDTAHVFAVGDSAGAHNLGLYTSICTNPAYAKKYGFKPPKGFIPTAIALNCGAYRIETKGKENKMTHRLMRDFLPNKGRKDELALIDVERHVTRKYPPTFVMTAVKDFLKEQAPLIVNKLEECGIPFEYKCYGDDKHPLGHVFHCDIKTKEAAICNDEETEFFRRFI